jgi:serine/threonine protein kinase
MNNPPQPNTCPQCRAVLPADAPQGLCPACLLAAVAEPTEAGTAPLPKAPPPTREHVAAAFPQLEILELIGAGGMGYVFKARQPKLDRLVALKLLPQSLAADPAFAGRFEREGRILARLNHPNIVTVHDFGFAPSPIPHSPDAIPSAGFYYLLMEFVDGVNLRQAMRAGRFTSVQALEVVPKICEALHFAHEQGILHRDIKPENILLDAKGRVKLVDFGIAKLVDDGRAELPLGLDAEAAQQRGPTTLTSATAALGTPSYMAPEQRDRPADVDHRADIYSLGVVFYEMLTGELPVGKFAPPSAKSASDPRVDEVVLRALEQQRERRQQSAGEVKTQVETIASTPATPKPAAPLSTYAQKKTKDAFVGPGFAVQVLGIVCLFIPFIGLFLGIVLIIIGTQMAVRVFCTNCGQQAARDASHCEHCNALFSGPPPRLGFFRRSLGWSIFLGALATLALVIGLTILIGGTAFSEWLKNSPLFTSRKSAPATTTPATKNTPAETSSVSHSFESTPKQFTLTRFTNMNGHATAWVETPLEPGESALTYLVHPDGRREPAPVMEFLNQNSLGERTTLSWRWRLPPPFTTNGVDEVVAQLRDRWQGTLLSCPPGKPVNVFTITNEFGAQVAGEVVFERVLPDPTKPAVAEVRVRRISSQSSFISINVGSTVPVGYALRASCTGSGSSRGDSSLVRSSSSDDRCTWMWPGTDFGGELAQEAVRQVQEQMARSPWLLTNGQPRTVFSVTNATGEVYAGQLELRGATNPMARVPRPPIQSSKQIESKSPKPTALEPAQKQFVPTSFTNLQGAALMRTETPLGPGESAHAWLVHADGRRERAWTLEGLFYRAGLERTIRSWNWRLPAPFGTNQTDEVVAQLRERWQGRPMACPLGQPVTVFTLTNVAGLRVSGEVLFNRTSPDLAKPAVAEVRLQNQVKLLLFFTSQVPAGYSLHIRNGGTASQAAHSTLSRSSHNDADDATCSWLWTDAGFDKEAAAKQAAALFAQGPLLITNGQPRTVFSVTNATGEAYVGQFELRGPASTK